ncbi:MAG: AsmA family protein, partial [Luteimonas sp.]
MTTPPVATAPATAPFVAIARHPWWTALAIVLAAIVVLLLLWDWNWFKGPIERQVEARTGRSFEIGGDLDVDLGRVTTIRTDALSFGNAPWAKTPSMASTDRLEFGIEIWPLLFKHQMRIPDIHLTQPRLRLERGPKGVGNWVFGEQGKPQPEFRRLWIDDGRLRYLDASKKTDVDVAINSAAQGKTDAAPPIDVTGGGRWQGNRFTVRGRAESPLDLRDS